MDQRKAKVVVPEHLSFSDLGLKRLDTGKIEFDWGGDSADFRKQRRVAH